MQYIQNNDIPKFPSEKKKGLAGSLIIHTLLLLVLVFAGFKIPPPFGYEEGILVNFGTDETGFGLIEPGPLLQVSLPSSSAVRSSRPRPATTTGEQLLTQTTEDAPSVVGNVDPNAERRRLEQAEAERISREEADRIRREEERIAAERQREANIANNIRDALAGTQNTAGSSEGVAGGRNIGSTSNSEGIAGGTGNQGVPTGSLDSNVRGDGGTGSGNSGTGSGSGGTAVSYSLGDRRSQGALPLPRYEQQVAGRVVVQISVDREGRVTQATPGVQGSTTLNSELLNAARTAAMQARFERAPNAPITQGGTITYNFVLR